MIHNTHLLIPDTQVAPGRSIDHLVWLGKYIVDRCPQKLIQIGDWHDMPSLSSYDKGKKCFEGRRYRKDIDAGNEALERMEHEIRKSAKLRRTLRRFHFRGNHEYRIHRAVDDAAVLDGTIGYKDLAWEQFGWRVYDFLEVGAIDGVAYSHFFPRSGSGSVTQSTRGAPNARAQVIREGRSATAGHLQGLDVACMPLGGRLQWGLIAGSYYQHDEGYLGPQGNSHWRGIVVKHNVHKGSYNPMFVDLAYLRSKYA